LLAEVVFFHNIFEREVNSMHEALFKSTSHTTAKSLILGWSKANKQTSECKEVTPSR
jgi:hypothetical protein